MGLKGPLRDPDSIRGQAEQGQPLEAPIQQAPEPPKWLTKAEGTFFQKLVDDAIASRTPLLKIDAFSYGNIARLQCALQKEKDGNVQARIMRSLLPWMQAAGLNAMGRARLGVRQTERKKSETTRLLEMRKSL